MSNPLIGETSRRDLLTKAVPGCLMTCAALSGLPLAAQTATPGTAETGAEHKFDREIPRALTYRQVAERQNRTLIPLLAHLEEELGTDKTIALLKKWSAKRGADWAKRTVEQLKSNEFAALRDFFDPASPRWVDSLTMELVESTDRVHELRVTECLFATPVIKAKVGELGNAAVCHGDYAFARTFNPEFEMVRDKTLMQGHDCCNHRYLWKA